MQSTEFSPRALRDCVHLVAKSGPTDKNTEQGRVIAVVRWVVGIVGAGHRREWWCAREFRLCPMAERGAKNSRPRGKFDGVSTSSTLLLWRPCRRRSARIPWPAKAFSVFCRALRSNTNTVHTYDACASKRAGTVTSLAHGTEASGASCGEVVRSLRKYFFSRAGLPSAECGICRRFPVPRHRSSSTLMCGGASRRLDLVWPLKPHGAELLAPPTQGWYGDDKWIYFARSMSWARVRF